MSGHVRRAKESRRSGAAGGYGNLTRAIVSRVGTARYRPHPPWPGGPKSGIELRSTTQPVPHRARSGRSMWCSPGIVGSIDGSTSRGRPHPARRTRRSAHRTSTSQVPRDRYSGFCHHYQLLATLWTRGGANEHPCPRDPCETGQSNRPSHPGAIHKPRDRKSSRKFAESLYITRVFDAFRLADPAACAPSARCPGRHRIAPAVNTTGCLAVESPCHRLLGTPEKPVRRP